MGTYKKCLRILRNKKFGNRRIEILPTPNLFIYPFHGYISRYLHISMTISTVKVCYLFVTYLTLPTKEVSSFKNVLLLLFIINILLWGAGNEDSNETEILRDHSKSVFIEKGNKCM